VKDINQNQNLLAAETEADIAAAEDNNVLPAAIPLLAEVLVNCGLCEGSTF